MDGEDQPSPRDSLAGRYAGESLTFSFPEPLTQALGMAESFQPQKALCSEINFTFLNAIHFGKPIRFDGEHNRFSKPYYVTGFVGTTWTVAGS